jgi:hypothetical protein
MMLSTREPAALPVVAPVTIVFLVVVSALVNWTGVKTWGTSSQIGPVVLAGSKPPQRAMVAT